MTKRILIYGMNYSPEIAGVGRYTGEIGAYLAALGHEVSVVTTPPHYPGWSLQAGYGPRRWSVEIVAGATVFRCPLYLARRMGGVWRLIAPLSFALSSAPVALWRILRQRPQVVLAIEPTLFIAPIALLGARLIGAKAVLHVQDLEVEAAFAMGHLQSAGLLRRAALLFDRTMTRGFDRVITISRRMAEKIEAKGVSAERIEIVRNWVDLAKIHPDLDSSEYRRALGLPAKAFVVLYSGNLGAKQGVALLIEAARRVAGERNIHVVIAGDGPMRADVEAAAADLPNLKLLPFQPEARLGEFLQVADLHVLPQEREAADLLLPSKLGGMLASGRPILVTAEPGTELWDFLGRSCRFSPPGDAQAMAQAILAATAAKPDAEARAKRLALAKQLSRTELIAAFARAALFLHDDDDAPARRRAA